MTQYLNDCRNNHFATFVNKRSQMVDLFAIDIMFRKLLEGAVDPKPLLPIAFLFRAHSAYLSAVGAVMAGQLHESQCLLRACLEQAAYGNFIGNDQARWERWINRHDSADAQKTVRVEFTHSKVARHLTLADATLGSIYLELYDRTIDYGAHPNERGSSMSSAIVDLPDGGKKFLTVYIHNDGLMLDFCLKETAHVGLCALRIARVIYPMRFETVAIERQLDNLCKRF